MVKHSEKQLNRVFHSLSDPTRRKILEMVARRRHSATQLADSFRMSFPAVSKHLKILEEAGLLRRKIEGRVHWFSFEDKTMGTAQHWIQFYRRFWLDRLDQLNTILKASQKKEE
jgi:DNA-binding transcriptional ArsR family regulator